MSMTASVTVNMTASGDMAGVVVTEGFQGHVGIL